ncbi:glucose 1-dehydrogenase [Virgifigura deserti]|uniref:glucose 1-dehydrogenase n=1 Tax=Virgifigura deserti TaxID=2268457 RepID=UPI003CCC3857
MMGRVEGKVAIVTGATKGLGRASAILLAREGAKVVLTGRTEAEGEEAVRAIVAEGGEAVFVKQDVADARSWPGLIEETVSRYGRLDILVNNAGIAIAANVEETTLEQWRLTMAVNLDGVFLGTKYAIGAMKKTGGGSIINLSSIDGNIGEADLAAYCASKGGVRTFTKAAAVHCGEAGYNIRVNSIHPGYIWTPQTQNYLADLGTAEEEKRKAAARHPIGRLGEPDDIAYGVLYLASDESKFVTGSELVIDGGYIAQ